MAASSAVPGVVDSTKPKSYPVILSDALLGKAPKEAITAIRYNHRPTLSSDAAPNSAELKPTSSNNDSFDMSFYENGGKYAFNGTRSTKENQYVLLFDPERKAFVLHRLDSMLNMNVTRTPTNNDADDLREKYPHIDNTIKPPTADKKGAKAPAAGKATKENKKSAAANNKKKDASSSAAAAAAAPKAEAPAPESKSSSSQPPAAAAAAAASAKADRDKKKRRNRSPVGSEEDEDDSDDGGLLVEYPDPAPAGPSRQDFSPAFPTTIRRFSEFVQNEKSEDEGDEDADAEYDEDDILLGEDDDDVPGGDGFKLPNPLGSAQRSGGGDYVNNNDDDDNNNNNNNSNTNINNANDVTMVEEDEDDDFGELEKALEKELGMDVDSESSVSEED
ncbi:hypothetical protein SLS53_005177 [Cytospora paraplurivora]|uniref:Transcription elongation factor Eaf N-terminal domain-containing protein n=1 Tax=Cytospora paraplurivora TaxID=2898453 RepID=A0AAN9YG97_9PEZI